MTQTQVKKQTPPETSSCHVCHLLASAPGESIVHVRLLSATAKAEAGAERVYLMGVGENQRRFHFLLLSRSAAVPAEMRGTGILVHTPEMVDRDEAFRVGARMRESLSKSVVLHDERR
jgi:hypothetical protein